MEQYNHIHWQCSHIVLDESTSGSWAVGGK